MVASHAESAVGSDRSMVWDRVLTLCDAGTFVPSANAAVLAGEGRVGGRPIVVYGHDPGVGGGALGAAEADEIVRAIRFAGHAGVPLVGLMHCAGARLQEGATALVSCARVLREHALLSERVPQIAVVCGPCAGAGAYAPALTDFVIMTDAAALFLTGPRVVRAATGECVDADRLGGARVHGRSGLCHRIAASDAEAIGVARDLLGLVPSRAGASAPRIPARPPQCADPAAVLPASPRRGYDMRDVIAAVFDAGAWLELSPDWARNVLVGLARLEGRAVGIVASQPRRLGGLLDAAASDKAARFVGTCDRLALPLVVLVDTPGFFPGRRQEAAGVLHHGSALLHAFATARVPKLTVILRKAFGGAFIALNAGAVGAHLTLIWPDAEVGIMAPGAASTVVGPAAVRGGMTASLAAASGVVDDVVAPEQTRARLASALATLDR